MRRQKRLWIWPSDEYDLTGVVFWSAGRDGRRYPIPIQAIFPREQFNTIRNRLQLGAMCVVFDQFDYVGGEKIKAKLNQFDQMEMHRLKYRMGMRKKVLWVEGLVE